MPTNDNFSSAQSISGTSGTAAFDLTGATSETGEPTPALGKTVWFAWTAPSSDPIQFDTTASVGDPDTYLSVYTGTAVNALTLIANDDDSGNNPAVGDPRYGASLLTFSPTSGTTYYIQIDAYTTGISGILTWQPGTLPPPPAPTISSYDSSTDPGTHMVHAPGDFTVLGTGLDYVDTVTIGGGAASFTLVDSTHLTIHAGSTARSGSLVISNLGGSATATDDATVLFYGPWIQPPDQWGPEKIEGDVSTILFTQDRVFPLLDTPTPSVWYDGPDTSVAGSGTSHGGSGPSVSLQQSGDYSDSAYGSETFGQFAIRGGYVDVNNGSSTHRHRLMPELDPLAGVTDPHVVDSETEDTHGDGTFTGTFEAKLRMHVWITRQQWEDFPERDYDGTPHHVAWDWDWQIRQLSSSQYAIWTGSGSSILPAWLFPSDLAPLPVLLDTASQAAASPAHSTLGTGTAPTMADALREELYLDEATAGVDPDLGTDLGVVEIIADDPGDRAGLVATFDGYAAGTRPTALDSSTPGTPTDAASGTPWLNPSTGLYEGSGFYVNQPGAARTFWSVWYRPSRYRLIYDAPPVSTSGWQVGSVAW